MNKLTETEKAYLAGLIDGEGCFNIDKKKSVHTKREHDFTGRVLIVNSNLDMMSWVLRTVGEGGIYVYKKAYSNKWKPVHRWVICGNKAQDFVKQIYPYLQAKTKQAELFLSFPSGHKGYRGRTDEQYKLQETIYAGMGRLNQRGSVIE